MCTDATLTVRARPQSPKSIRDSLRMKAGDKMSFTLMPDGVVVMRVKNKHVSDLGGLLLWGIWFIAPITPVEHGWLTPNQRIRKTN
jgi:antitoxin PrlF